MKAPMVFRHLKRTLEPVDFPAPRWSIKAGPACWFRRSLSILGLLTFDEACTNLRLSATTTISDPSGVGNLNLTLPGVALTKSVRATPVYFI
jgi:hypothetical protein